MYITKKPDLKISLTREKTHIKRISELQRNYLMLTILFLLVKIIHCREKRSCQ